MRNNKRSNKMSSPSFSSEEVKMANQRPTRTRVPFRCLSGLRLSLSNTRALCSGLA